MPDVTSIPTELWRNIITIACTDGGFTGTSLAFTSKFFHAQSHDLRFHSLALNSLRQLEGFCAFVQLQAQHGKPRIEHLYLSFFNIPQMLRSDPRHAALGHSRPMEFDNWTTEVQARWNERLAAAWTTLITHAAPTLRTLCIVEEDVPLALGFSCDLPRLEELSWRGYIRAFRAPGLQEQGASLRRFPSLKRVHFVSGNSDSVVDALAAAVPSSLTHLRISNVSDWDAKLPAALARALGLPPPPSQFWDAPDDEDVQPEEATLPHLRVVVIHAMPPDTSDEDAAPFYYDPWQSVCEELDWLVRKGQERMDRVQVLMVAGKRRWGSRWAAERMRVNWLSRMTGGQGCWTGSEEEEVDFETAYEDDPHEEYPSDVDEDFL
ncbi:uncharacterized protein TRAVEDRAFT_69879 [Trametes versicolor FP-101664 SS1]|uniref:uncharacterized protein n=1 Tax=Trametes versicolor (strain FP-101664) TaxID=717944 RepID=UPI00046235F0|nr:uncharacterized protein TRAVEDRAFT_69879 [Trametes versicolor FP-101664 SS1]EIW61549.1 hypothetical protein TRAVEDRAFT_69879 [Trametes versicolor FP-101664 SS1]